MTESFGADAFETLAVSQSVQWGANLPLLPAPGSSITVTAGEFYRTDDERMPVVKVIQTHSRDDPQHTDLSQLLALFEPQRDPLNPAPWVAPAGTVGMYRLTNLIGGPELCTHAGHLWRSQNDANVWEPGTVAETIWIDEGVI